MLLRKNYKTLSLWRKPEPDDYANRDSEYIFIKKFKGLIQYPTGQYYSKLEGIHDKESLRMSGILFAPKSVKFESKNIVRNVDGRAFAMFSVVPENQNIGMISSLGSVEHNEYRLEFLNDNISLPNASSREGYSG